jgi:P-type Ca2+ transporter type 2C
MPKLKTFKELLQD